MAKRGREGWNGASLIKHSKHGTKTYIGMTERAFKQRYTEHKQSLPSRTSRMDPVERKKKYEHKSELSAYAWKLHEEGTGYKIKWKIHSKAYPYRGGSRRCDLCLSEKLVIALSDPETTLNSRSELTSKCRHKWKYSLRVSNWDIVKNNMPPFGEK